jgi:transcriptional regulator with XRE-family HTH domain
VHLADSEAVRSNQLKGHAENGFPPRRRGIPPRAAARGRHAGSSSKPKLAAVLKARRGELGLTQQSLSQKLGIRASHIALLESGRRRPSLGLIVRLVAQLGIDGRALLELAYPEIRTLLTPIRRRPAKLGASWQRLFKNNALLERYHVSPRELDALEHLGMLGGKLTAKRLLAILLLVRDIP